MRKKRRLSRRYALAGIIVLVPILSPTPAEAGSPPSLEAKAWLYEAKDTYTRTDDDTLSPAGSDSTGFYWENNIDATGGSANPARLNSNDPIWDVYSDGSTLYRLVFQLQADTTDLEYSCSVENDGYWYVNNEDGYWVYTDTAATKEILSAEKVANQDVADTSGVGSSIDDYRLAQSFIAQGEVIAGQIYGRKTPGASASAILRIETDDSGEPSGTLVSSDAIDTLPASCWPTSNSWVTFSFDSTLPLQDSTTYHMLLKDDQTDNGENIVVCDETDGQQNQEMASDGYHGAIITWADYRSGQAHIYAQRVDSLGNALWTTDGVVVCQGAQSEENPAVVGDGYHGAIITWVDYRNGNYDIYAQRVDSLGNTKWTANGVVICDAAEDQVYVELASDDYHGAIITWRDYRNGNLDIYAQRVDSSGNAVWTADGVAICTASSGQLYPQLVSDGYHGAIITWDDWRSGNYDIYAQRVDSLGNTKWTADGAVVCDATGGQAYPTVVSDGCHGAVIAWQDARNGTYSDIYVQRVDSLGNLLWADPDSMVTYYFNGYDSGQCWSVDPGNMVDGDASSSARTDYDNPSDETQLCNSNTCDGSDLGAIAKVEMRAKIDVYDPDGRIYITTIFPGGDGITHMFSNISQSWTGWLDITSELNAPSPWTWSDVQNLDVKVRGVDPASHDCSCYKTELRVSYGQGVAVCKASDNQDAPQIVSDDYHGAIITWEDDRNGTSDVYAQRVDSLGNMLWTSDGVAVCDADYRQDDMRIAADGDHGAVIAWRDNRNGTDDNIYARRVDSLGTTLWTSNGVLVCGQSNAQEDPRIVSDDHHGAFVVWRDQRNGSEDIYLEAVDPLGNVRWNQGIFRWAYEPADYADGEMLERSSGSAPWVHHTDKDLLFKFPAWLITDYESGWWSDPKDISHQYAPDRGKDITKIDTDKRLECIDATRNWLGDAYDGEDVLYADTDSTLIWELFFKVDQDWTDNDTANLHLYIYKAGGGHSTDIALKLHTTSAKLKWMYPEPDSSPIPTGVRASPIVRGGRVYFAGMGTNKEFYCLGASDGSLKWTYTAQELIYTSPSAAYEDPNWTTYFASDGGWVYALTDTGSSYEEKWKVQVTPGNSIRCSPIIMDSLLYVGSHDDSLHCLRTSDGSQKWAAHVSDYVNFSAVTVFSNVVYVGSNADTVYAVNAADGTILRRYGVCGNINAPTFLTWSTGLLCIGSCASTLPGSDTLYVINSSNFDTYWKFADSGNLASMNTSCFSLDDRNVYFGNDNNYLYCIDISDSSLVYKYETGGNVNSSPLLWDGVVYFGSDDYKFYALDDNTQQPVTGWPFVSNGPIESSPGISLDDGIVVVGARDGHVYAFHLE